MGRGRLLKTKVKEAKALEKARLEGQWAAEKKKPWEVSLREHIGKFLDTLEAEDVLSIISWLGLAYLIKPQLDSLEELQSKLQLVRAVEHGVDAKIFKGLPIVETLTSILPMNVIVAAGFPTPDAMKESLEATDWQTWILALAISALIIKFGPSVLQAAGGMGKLALLLLI